MWFYKVAEPNEALIVSGLRSHELPEGGGKGPRVQDRRRPRRVRDADPPAARPLSLDLHEVELDIDCVTTQGIPVGVKAVVIYKVGDDFPSISNAARRFLEQEDQMNTLVHNVFAGHLRSIVGSMTVEEMIRARDRLTTETRESSAIEMQKLGLVDRLAADPGDRRPDRLHREPRRAARRPRSRRRRASRRPRPTARRPSASRRPRR